MVLMEKKKKKKRKSSLVNYCAPVAKYEDEKNSSAKYYVAGSNCRVEPEG